MPIVLLLLVVLLVQQVFLLVDEQLFLHEGLDVGCEFEELPLETLPKGGLDIFGLGSLRLNLGKSLPQKLLLLGMFTLKGHDQMVELGNGGLNIQGFLGRLCSLLQFGYQLCPHLFLGNDCCFQLELQLSGLAVKLFQLSLQLYL